jgi:hypothetical protein
MPFRCHADTLLEVAANKAVADLKSVTGCAGLSDYGQRRPTIGPVRVAGSPPGPSRTGEAMATFGAYRVAGVSFCNNVYTAEEVQVVPRPSQRQRRRPRGRRRRSRHPHRQALAGDGYVPKTSLCAGWRQDRGGIDQQVIAVRADAGLLRHLHQIGDIKTDKVEQTLDIETMVTWVLGDSA